MHQSGVSIEPTPEIVTGTLRMLQDRLLIKPLDWNGEQVHGADSRIIVMRDGRPVRGTVVAVGPGRHPFIRKGRTNDGRHTRVEVSKRFQPTEVKVGDVVELGGLIVRSTLAGVSYNMNMNVVLVGYRLDGINQSLLSWVVIGSQTALHQRINDDVVGLDVFHHPPTEGRNVLRLQAGLDVVEP
jgi:hypothetical protein